MKRLLSIVGARPQFVKAAELHRALDGRCLHELVHTGQHYDEAMSHVFFKELEIPEPLLNLGAGAGTPGAQTARMIEGLEQALINQQPDAVILYGDTTSTLAGAVAAAKLGTPIAHIEAGMRSYRKSMPEEVNRVLSDHCSTWLFCPTESAKHNLLREGFSDELNGVPNADQPHIHVVGDLMLDSAMRLSALAQQRSGVLSSLVLEPGHYAVATVHRDFNSDQAERLMGILQALEEIGIELGIPVVMPLHPRTRARLDETGWLAQRRRWLRVTEPVGYLDMIQLERNARAIITDSGGVQKEAFFFRKPCIVLRDETEWTELIEHGQARLAGADPDRMKDALRAFLADGLPPAPALYGDGHAAESIARILLV